MNNPPYILEALRLSGFRAYLVPKTFDFSTKRCLAVFAPNGNGKSSIIDALEFMFSEDGTLKRLGVRTIHNQAGVAALTHNRAAEENIDPHVCMRFKRGIDKTEALRNAAGSTRPRPPAADAVNACFAVEPIIRGHSLRGFVEDQTAEERYEVVASWLQLGPLVNVQRNLRSLRQRTKAAAEDRTGLTRVDTQLAKKTANAVTTWDEVAVRAHVNSILAKLDSTLTTSSLTRTDAAFISVQERAKTEERELGLEGLRQINRVVASLYQESGDQDGISTPGLLTRFESAVEVQAKARETEVAERRAAANAVFENLWKVAAPIFAESATAPDSCPLCGTSISASALGSVVGIRDHIAKHRAELAEYAKAKDALDRAALSVSDLHAQLLTALKALAPLLGEKCATTKDALATYLGTIETWSGGTLPEATALKASLRELTSALNSRIDEIETRQGENTYRKALSIFDDLIELKSERELAVRTLDELGKLSLGLNTQTALISSEIRRKVQALLDTLQSPINNIYQKIQGTDAAPIRLELPSEEDTNQQRLNLVVDFAANRTNVQPSGYLSDSQIHSLALALRLAAIKRFNSAAPIIALDDVVTSYDADHRRSVAALLASEFAGFQIIVTTHDERFFIYLKDQLGDRDWHFTRMTGLDADFGPRFAEHRVSDSIIEDRWRQGESAANEMRQAEEEWLLGVCREFGVFVRIRSVDKAHSYERSELAEALTRFLRDKGLTPPLIPGVNNRFLTSLQIGAVENFGSHFQDGPYGRSSIGDERERWDEFKKFREYFACPKCGKKRFKSPLGMSKPVCANERCEAQFEFSSPIAVNEASDEAVSASASAATVSEVVQ